MVGHVWVSGCVRSELPFGQNGVQAEHPFHALMKKGAGCGLEMVSNFVS